MRGERQRIFLLDTTLLDCMGSAGLAAHRSQRMALAKSLGDLGIDYIASRDVAQMIPPGRLGRSPSPTSAATPVCAWQLDGDRCGGEGVGSASHATREGTIGAGGVLVTLAADTAGNGALADHALAEIARIAATGREAIVEVAGHFDALAREPARQLEVVAKVLAAGARWIVLSDAVRPCTPDEVAEGVRATGAAVPDGCLGIMASNGGGQGVVNTLAALRAGCRLACGTLTGLGRSGGQASLATLIPTLLLNSDLAERFATRVTAAQLAGISHATRLLASLLTDEDAPAQPGRSSSPTAHHDAAHAASPSPPTASLAGAGHFPATPPLDRSGLLCRLDRLGITPPEDEAQISRLIGTIAARDRLGYGLAEADGAFELVVRRALGEVPRFFSVVDFHVGLIRRRDARGRLARASDAEVVLKVDGADALIRSAGGGKGPVDALDRALRCNLGRYQALVRDVELSDYTVRILTRGGEAVTRVSVENRNCRTGARWLTVGVAPSIVDASLEALVDGLTFCLLKAGAPA